MYEYISCYRDIYKTILGIAEACMEYVTRKREIGSLQLKHRVFAKNQHAVLQIFLWIGHQAQRKGPSPSKKEPWEALKFLKQSDEGQTWYRYHYWNQQEMSQKSGRKDSSLQAGTHPTKSKHFINWSILHLCRIWLAYSMVCHWNSGQTLILVCFWSI